MLFGTQNGSFMKQEICFFHLSGCIEKRIGNLIRCVSLKKEGANDSSLTLSLGCLCRHQCSSLLIAPAASASLSFTLNRPVLCLVWAGVRGKGAASQCINESRRTYSLLLLLEETRPTNVCGCRGSHSLTYLCRRN